MLKQRITKLGCQALALIGVAALALEVGVYSWSLVKAPDAAFAHRWPALESKAAPEAPVVADAPMEPLSPAPETKPQQESMVQLAALDPGATPIDDSNQPASKGYIFYFNSPTHWQPWTLPSR